MTIETVSTVDVVENRRRQAEKWAEVQRLAQLAANGQYNYTSQSERMRLCAELLAEIGVIHNTPTAKGDWINGR